MTANPRTALSQFTWEAFTASAKHCGIAYHTIRSLPGFGSRESALIAACFAYQAALIETQNRLTDLLARHGVGTKALEDFDS